MVCVLVAPKGEKEARALKEKFLEELKGDKINHQMIELRYENKTPRFVFLLGIDHPFQDVAKRMDGMDEKKIFEMHEMRHILKFSEEHAKTKTD